MRGNRTSKGVTGDENYTISSTYDNNNRLTKQTKSVGGTQTEGTQYYYDNNGNQTFKQRFTYSTGELMSMSIGTTSDDIESFTYNARNQLTRYTKGSTSASYTYGANGLRKSKTVGSTTMGFIWNGNNVAGEKISGSIQNIYSYGSDGIAVSNINGTLSYYLKDAHGNVIGTTNTSGVQDSNSYSYDAFGNQFNAVQSTDTNPFRYCGEYFDVETESVYLRARYYSPVSGRFITEDPIRDELNWYSYATNNPIAFIDPLGTNDVPIYDNDSTVIDVKYDLRELVSLVGGVLKVDGNIVKIKALGKITEINIQEVAQQDKNLRVEDRHIISDHLHYTLKDFLNLIGADYSIATVQMTVTSSDVRYQKWSQRAGKTAMKVLEDSASSVVAASGVIGQAITSFTSLFDGWGGNYKEILTEGFYKKQFIEIYDEHGKGIIINYIVPRPTAYSNNNLGIYVKELWNADMNEMAWAGWKYP